MLELAGNSGYLLKIMFTIVQGTIMVTVDNVVAAGGKRREAMPHLGHGLPLMDNGDADPGTRQDILHAQKRITEKLSKAEGLSDTAGAMCSQLGNASQSREQSMNAALHMPSSGECAHMHHGSDLLEMYIQNGLRIQLAGRLSSCPS